MELCDKLFFTSCIVLVLSLWAIKVTEVDDWGLFGALIVLTAFFGSALTFLGTIFYRIWA